MHSDISLPVYLTLFVIPSIITTWILFKKAGQPGIAAIVPVYSEVIMAKIGGISIWWGVTAGILSLVVFMEFDGAILVALAALFITIWLVVGMKHQYNRGGFFWFCYLFLPWIALAMVRSRIRNPFFIILSKW